MVTLFDDISLFQDDDDVGITNRGQPVRDHECGPARA